MNHDQIREANHILVKAHIERIIAIAEYVGVLKSSGSASAEELELGKTKLTEAKVELLAELKEQGL